MNTLRWWLVCGFAAIIAAFAVLVVLVDGYSGLEKLSWVATVLGVLITAIALVVAWPRRSKQVRTQQREEDGRRLTSEVRPASKYNTTLNDAHNVQIGDHNVIDVDDSGERSRGRRHRTN